MKIYLTIVTFLITATDVLAKTTLIPEKSDPKFGKLAQKFTEGTLQLYDIPFYIMYLTQKLVGIAGMAAVIFFMYGGYLYLMESYSGEASTSKTYMKNAVIGFVISLSAWIIIDLAIRLLTE